ncbi:transposase [Burkholderia lata]|nr:transposase [Burkholderia lata]
MLSRRLALLVCTATLIQAPPGLRTVLRMSSCLLQGFSQGLLEIAFATLLVLNYMRPSRRTQAVEVQLQIVGDDDWTARKHGFWERGTSH